MMMMMIENFALLFSYGLAFAHVARYPLALWLRFLKLNESSDRSFEVKMI
jgi:hypothetical protein